MKKIIFFLLIGFSFLLYAEDEVIQVQGQDRTLKGAVQDALIIALEQKCGMTMSSAQRSSISMEANRVTEDGRKRSKREASDKILKECEKWTQGRISGFDIVSQSYDKETKNYIVVLNVRIPGRYIVGRDPNALRRMVVGTFYAKNAECSFYGKKLSTEKWAKQFADDLNVHLTQTRKFTMLDRAFDKDSNAELARLTGSNAAPADVVRLNQKLGTDYLVVGYVTFSDVVSGGENPMTGEALPPPSSVFATVHYRIILAPTGQLKWADTIVVDSLYFTNSLYAGNFADSAAYAAAAVCAGIMSNILPLEVVSVTADGSVVIGEGGKALQEGEHLSVYALGENVMDTRTGEVLDQTESCVGLVQVTRVSAKLSYAKVVKGDIKQIPVGARLRRDRQAVQANSAAAPAAPASPSQVFGTQNGGVVVPF